MTSKKRNQKTPKPPEPEPETPTEAPTSQEVPEPETQTETPPKVPEWYEAGIAVEQIEVLIRQAVNTLHEEASFMPVITEWTDYPSVAYNLEGRAYLLLFDARWAERTSRFLAQALRDNVTNEKWVAYAVCRSAVWTVLLSGDSGEDLSHDERDQLPTLLRSGR